MAKVKTSILLGSTMLTLVACGGGGSGGAPIRNIVNNNIEFSNISSSISSLAAVVDQAQASATIQSLVKPTEIDRNNAKAVVAEIDNVINNWNSYKNSLDIDTLVVKIQTDEWKKAEAVIKILKEDMRTVVQNVVDGGTYETTDLSFLDKPEAVNKRIVEKKQIIYNDNAPTIIHTKTDIVTVSEFNESTSSIREVSTDVKDIDATSTGGTANNLVRKKKSVRTTTINQVEDQFITIGTRPETTIIYSNGKKVINIGSVVQRTTKKTIKLKPKITSVEIQTVVPYTTKEKNAPRTVVINGEPTTTKVYKDYVKTEVQGNGSKLHKTFTKTTTTKTTPITTKLIYPKITLYTYEDGHSFTLDEIDEVTTSTKDKIEVSVNESLKSSSAEHIIKSESTTNEVITDTVVSDPTTVVVHEDKTTSTTTDNKITTVVTRYYITTKTTKTTVTTKTTPVTTKIWTNNNVDTIRGETTTKSSSSNDVKVTNHTQVMSTNVVDVNINIDKDHKNIVDVNIGEDHVNMGTRTANYNSDANSYRTDEFNGSGGDNFNSAINAEYAYSRGWTGKGSTIVIADTGWDRDHKDLGNVTATYNTLNETKTIGTSDATMQDNVGHGSHVMGIAAGLKNGSGMHGVAFDANVMVAKITDNYGYSFQRALKAAEWGRDNKAVAMNISANWNADSSFRRSIVDLGNNQYRSDHYYYGINGYNGAKQTASDWKTALGNDMILVNSAGNQGYNFTYGTGQMAIATDINGKLILDGKMIIVGNYSTSNGNINGNKAGNVCVTWINGVCQDAAKISDYYILAPGTMIQSAYKDGSLVHMTGTSMSAPVVTGSLAILNQMWPHMKGKNLVQLVLKTADKNLVGYSVNTHGQGLLDLNKATQPVGATGIPKTGRTDGAISGNLNGGAGVGNISSGSFMVLSNVIVLDSFERDFTVDLSKTVAIDTRPGSVIETIAFSNGNYNAYGNLAQTSDTLPTFTFYDVKTTYKFNNGETNGDYNVNSSYNAYENDTTKIDFGLGFVKETGKFLNNVQNGVLGVGENHHTTYATAKLNHNLSNKLSVNGNYQVGYTNVESSKDFSLITGYSGLTSQSWNIGTAYKVNNKLTFGATYAQPLTVTNGTMDYKVPVARTLDGNVLYNEGSVSAASQVQEHNVGLSMNYNASEKFSLSAFGEQRYNVAGLNNNDQYKIGVNANYKGQLEKLPFELLETANLITELDTSSVVNKSKKLISEFGTKKLINRIKKLGWK